jgi:WD40 repeat protein
VGDGIVYLWDVAAARQIAALSVPTPAVPDDPSNSSDNSTVKAAFNRDGTRLAVADAVSNSAYLWDVATRKRIATFTSHGRNDGMTSIAFSPAGKALVTGEDHSDCFYVWHAD